MPKGASTDETGDTVLTGPPASAEAVGSVAAGMPRRGLCWSWIEWVEWSKVVWLRWASGDGWRVGEHARLHAELCHNTTRRRPPEGDGGTQRVQA